MPGTEGDGDQGKSVDRGTASGETPVGRWMGGADRVSWLVPAVAAGVAVVALLVPAAREFADLHPGAIVAAGLALVVATLARWGAGRTGMPVGSGGGVVARQEPDEGAAGAARAAAEATLAVARALASREVPGPIPVIAVDLGPDPTATRFSIVISNVGTGPALDLVVTLSGSPLSFRQEPPSRSQALGPGASLEMTFLLEEEGPFRDEAHPCRWPRDEADAEAMAAAERPERDDRTGMVLDVVTHIRRLDELQARYGSYRLELLAAIARDVTGLGTVSAICHDLTRQRRLSEVEVELPPSDRPDRPGLPRLGPLDVRAAEDAT
ncbi:MAG: hypothetical protein WKF80_00925 [Thermomicrobiales bacterium]